VRFLAGTCALAVVALSVLFAAPGARAQSETSPSAAELAAEIQALKREYETRIQALESQLSTLEAKSRAAERKAAGPAESIKATLDNAFNPAIGVVLNGAFSKFSADESEIPGFQAGPESERIAEGLSLGHSEITVSGNVDDKFRGNLTLGLGVHPGEPTELELEEAYVSTLPGAGLPEGLRVKAGRALWTFGYLNEQHAHGDDFVDRPLPYRAFLDNAYNDDGLELSFVLPTELYSEIGGGLYRGDDTPFGGSEDGVNAWSAYARLGGDIGRDSAWRVGAYVLGGDSHDRGGVAHEHGDEDEHEDEGEHEDEDEHEGEHEDEDIFADGLFTGSTRLYGADLRYTWAPTGNARDSELILQGEYFLRKEDGRYALMHEGEEEPDVEIAGDATGWYAQAVYKFLPRWRIGARYARLSHPNAAGIDHDPYAVGAMIDWSNSEFGRIRLQYNHEALSDGERDNQYILQYVVSLGAHAAHSF